MRLAASILFLLIATPCFAATYYVYVDGSGDFPDFHSALDASVDGDEILLGPGVHQGVYEVDDKGLTIRSVDGNRETCIIQRWISFWAWPLGTPTEIHIRDLTVDYIQRVAFGDVSYGTMFVDNVLFGTIDSQGAASLIEIRNSAVLEVGTESSFVLFEAVDGAVIDVGNCVLDQVNRQVLSGTSDDGAVRIHDSQISECTFSTDFRGDFYNCTIINNVGFPYKFSATNSVIAWNDFRDPSDIFPNTDCPVGTFSSCVYFENQQGFNVLECVPVTSNFIVDPLYCDPSDASGGHCADSVCLESNSGVGPIGIHGLGCGPCNPIATEVTSFGSVKSLYR